MATITNELTTIKSGIYGSDIRMAIHDALSKLSDGSAGAALSFRGTLQKTDLNLVSSSAETGIYLVPYYNGNNGHNLIYTNLPSDYNEGGNKTGLLFVHIYVDTDYHVYAKQELCIIYGQEKALSYRWSREKTSTGWGTWVKSGDTRAIEQGISETKEELDTISLNAFTYRGVLSSSNLNNISDSGIYGLSSRTSYTNLPSDYHIDANPSLPATTDQLGLLLVYNYGSGTYKRQEIIVAGRVGSAKAEELAKERWVRINPSASTGTSWTNWVKAGGSESIADSEEFQEALENVLTAHPNWVTSVNDGSITTAKLANAAVTSAKIANGAVTSDKLNSNVTNFTVAQTKNNIVSGESLSNILGKISKWFTELDAADEKYRVHKISVENVSTLPVTISNAEITSGMSCIKAELSDWSAMSGDWTVSTSNGSLTINGGITSESLITVTLWLAET